MKNMLAHLTPGIRGSCVCDGCCTVLYCTVLYYVFQISSASVSQPAMHFVRIRWSNLRLLYTWQYNTVKGQKLNCSLPHLWEERVWTKVISTQIVIFFSYLLFSLVKYSDICTMCFSETLVCSVHKAHYCALHSVFKNWHKHKNWSRNFQTIRKKQWVIQC